MQPTTTLPRTRDARVMKFCCQSPNFCQRVILFFFSNQIIVEMENSREQRDNERMDVELASTKTTIGTVVLLSSSELLRKLSTLPPQSIAGGSPFTGLFVRPVVSRAPTYLRSETLCNEHLSMASRGRHVEGSDGSDHTFRQRVADHYKDLHSRKSSLTASILPTVVVQMVLCIYNTYTWTVR